MSNGLNPYEPVALRPVREPRKVTRQAREIMAEGRLTDLKEDVVFTIGGRNMQRAAMLDMQRRTLSGNDPSLNTILCDIELETLQQAKQIQRGLFGGEF